MHPSAIKAQVLTGEDEGAGRLGGCLAGWLGHRNGGVQWLGDSWNRVAGASIDVVWHGMAVTVTRVLKGGCQADLELSVKRKQQ